MVVGGDTFKNKKPHPSVLNNIVKNFKLKKEKCYLLVTVNMITNRQ